MHKKGIGQKQILSPHCRFVVAVVVRIQQQPQKLLVHQELETPTIKTLASWDFLDQSIELLSHPALDSDRVVLRPNHCEEQGQRIHLEMSW